MGVKEWEGVWKWEGVEEGEGVVKWGEEVSRSEVVVE